MLLYGAILGVLSAIFSFMLYTMDMHYQGGIFVTIVSVVLSTALYAVAMYQFRNANSNLMSFWQGVKIGVGVAVISGIIIVLFNLLLTRVIDPETMTKAMNFQREQLIENTEMTIEQIDAQLEIAQQFQTPAIQAAFGLLFAMFFGLLLTLFVLYILGSWRLFTKAGFPGWGVFVPIYNLWILTRIVNKPSWWLLLLLIPVVNVVFGIWMMNLLSKQFKKDVDFTIGLVLLPFIFIPILGLNHIYIGEKFKSE